MRRRVWFALATCSVLVVAVVAVQPAEAQAPVWMRPVIADGRSGILQNIDSARTGSPVAFTEARCRADGALLLLYTQRWMWVVPQHFGVEIPADWQSRPKPRSYAGGVLEGLETDYGAELAGYFATYPEIDCPEDPLAVTKPSRSSSTLAPATMPTPALAPTITAKTDGSPARPTPDELILFENMVRFAQEPDEEALAPLPFADERALGLADRQTDGDSLARGPG